MRQAKVDIVYNGKNISADIAPYLLSFEYTDNESHKADSINIKLEDKNQLWIKPWLPAKGDTITASIVTTNWQKEGETNTLPCGTFQVDEINFSGPPAVVEIKGVSVPVTSSLRTETKNRAWENIDLRAIAQDIATVASMTLLYETDVSPQYLRIDQTEMSDLAFLQKLCDKAAQSLKVTSNQIVIFDERTYEAKDPVRTIDRLGGDVLSYSFKSKTAGTAKAAKVTYSDPLTGKTAESNYTDPNGTNNGATLNINECPDGDYDPGDGIDSTGADTDLGGDEPNG